MSKVVAHGYLGVTAPNLAEWRSYATEVLGAALGPDSDEERVYLRIDERAWRISVEEGVGGLAFCGWEVANADALEALAGDLDAAGVVYKEDTQLAAERRVNGLLTCMDPGGNQLEFFHGAYIPASPFVSPTGARFVTSARGPGDMGFGHSVIFFPHFEEAKHFYVEVLGFKISDTIDFSVRPGFDIKALFTHVNPRHHSLAILESNAPQPALHHFMFEVEDLAMVGRSHAAAASRSIEPWAIGQHSNDHMVSFYMATPSGFMIEYGTGGRRIDDGVWTTANYDSTRFWP